MERGIFHVRKTAFDSGSATVPVAPFGVPPNGSATGPDSQLEHHTAVTNTFGRRPKAASETPSLPGTERRGEVGESRTGTGGSPVPPNSATGSEFKNEVANLAQAV